MFVQICLTMLVAHLAIWWICHQGLIGYAHKYNNSKGVPRWEAHKIGKDIATILVLNFLLGACWLFAMAIYYIWLL